MTIWFPDLKLNACSPDIELFRNVILDFSEVPNIGQAFVDEIFRVFAHGHRHIKLILINANIEVMGMINRATSRAGDDGN
ncbi:MAG: STAS-like domain-containing protein [Chromatiales bacterium]|nr:STAS-like domain-containing protein [Chromatiales bacterium]